MEKSNRKIILVSDSPYASTGLGRMSKYFLKMLPEFHWVIWGVNHPHYNVRNNKNYAYFDEKDFEGEVTLYSPTMFTDDQYGFEYIPDLIKSEKPQFLLTSLDYDRILRVGDQIKGLQLTHQFKWVNYFPMDREDYKPGEVDSLRYPDINVCITKFGVKKIHSINPKVALEQIYHPVDADDFPLLSNKKRKENKKKIWPGLKPKTFITGSVSRSFARKDTARLVNIFSKFAKETKNTFHYIHGSRYTTEGIDLGQLALECGMPEKRLNFLPSSYQETNALTQEMLNAIYQTMDLYVTVSTGEGFGYSTVEALITQTPIIAPSNTSFPELVQDFGYLIDTEAYAYQYTKNGRSMWPVVNIDKVVKKMHYVRDNYTEAKEKAIRGSVWVKENLNLNVIADQWRKILK